jgi:hypothetical protein
MHGSAIFAGHIGPVTLARRGLSVAEVCLSLAISACLLVGGAAGFTASADAVRMNDQFFRATQAGRVTLDQLKTDIRRAETVEVTPDDLGVQIIRPALTRLPEETYREYRYDAANKRVTLQIFFSSPPAPKPESPVYTMAGNVEAASFGPPKRDDKTNAVIRVPIALKMKIGGNEVLLNGAASPRKLLNK